MENFRKRLLALAKTKCLVEAHQVAGEMNLRLDSKVRPENYYTARDVLDLAAKLTSESQAGPQDHRH